MKSHMISFSWLYSVYRVLSRIYRLGEKSRVAEGYEFPRGIRGDVPPRNIFRWICAEPEMQFGASWATVLRDVTVCALTWSRLNFFSDIVTYRLWWCVKKNVSQASYQSLQTTITEQVCKTTIYMPFNLLQVCPSVLLFVALLCHLYLLPFWAVIFH